MSSGLASVLLVISIGIWAVVIQLWLVSICYRKKKPVFARLGLIGLVVPGLFVFPLVGASRLAPPSSPWAALHYGDRFLGRSARRYPDDHDVAVGFTLPRERRTMWENIIGVALVATLIALVVLIDQANYAALGAGALLAEITVISWLAEVELSGRPYSARSIPATAPDPEPVPAGR